MNSGGYQNLIIRPRRPKFLEAIRETGKWSHVAVTSSLLAFIIAVLSWVVPSPPLKGFFQWSFVVVLLLFAVILFVSTVVYIVRVFRYVSHLERRILRIRRTFLAYSGVEDAEPWNELKYSLRGIVDWQGTVSLVIGLAGNPGLNPGALLDVVVSATGEVWGHVKVSRTVDEQAWAVPIDRKNPEFWESLEDRMKSDPSPPTGIHLEPFLPIAIRDLLLLDNRERKDA